MDIDYSIIETGLAPIVASTLIDSVGSSLSTSSKSIREWRAQAGSGQGTPSGQRLLSIDLYEENNYHGSGNCFFQATANFQTT